MEPDGCCRILSLDGWTGRVALEHLGQSRLPPAAGTTSAGMILAAVTRDGQGVHCCRPHPQLPSASDCLWGCPVVRCLGCRQRCR